MTRRMSYPLITVILGMLFCSGMVLAVSTYDIEAPTGPVVDYPLATFEEISGSGMASGNASPCDCGTDQIRVALPVGAQVERALLYWYGALRGNDNPPVTARIGPLLTVITGDKIGGPTQFFSEGGTPVYFSSFRADITDEINGGYWEEVEQAGGVVTYTLPIDLDFDLAETREEAAGLLVIFDDGTPPMQIEVRDGLDLAFFRFAPPLDTTVLQTFNFLAAEQERDAQVLLMIGSEGDDSELCRRNRMEIGIGDDPPLSEICCGSCFTLWWDSHMIGPKVPAGVTKLTAQVISDDDPTDPDVLGASLAWIVAAVGVEQVEPSIQLEREPLSWTYTIANPGPLPLQNLIVRAGPVRAGDVTLDCGGQTTLDVGASMTCTAVGPAAYHASVVWVYGEPAGGGIGTFAFVQPD
jgi:hypothetical protein